MSLGLLLDGILYLLPDYDTPCYQYKVVYSLFIVPIITSFFSVLGMSIERFQTFALYRDRRRMTKKFSIAWFVASWTLGISTCVQSLQTSRSTMLKLFSHLLSGDPARPGMGSLENLNPSTLQL